MNESKFWFFFWWNARKNVLAIFLLLLSFFFDLRRIFFFCFMHFTFQESMCLCNRRQSGRVLSSISRSWSSSACFKASFVQFWNKFCVRGRRKSFSISKSFCFFFWLQLNYELKSFVFVYLCVDIWRVWKSFKLLIVFQGGEKTCRMISS